jgi:hypothetical protein
MEEVIQTLQDTPVVDHSSDTNEEADEIGDDCQPGKLHSVFGPTLCRDLKTVLIY